MINKFSCLLEIVDIPVVLKIDSWRVFDSGLNSNTSKICLFSWEKIFIFRWVFLLISSFSCFLIRLFSYSSLSESHNGFSNFPIGSCTAIQIIYVFSKAFSLPLVDHNYARNRLVSIHILFSRQSFKNYLFLQFLPTLILIFLKFPCVSITKFALPSLLVVSSKLTWCFVFAFFPILISLPVVVIPVTERDTGTPLASFLFG